MNFKYTDPVVCPVINEICKHSTSTVDNYIGQIVPHCSHSNVIIHRNSNCFSANCPLNKKEIKG